MRADNCISIIGRVGKEPEMKYLSADKVVVTFNVAVNRPKDSTGNEITDWFKCEFWGKQAEVAGEYVKKGTLISVVGSCLIEQWEQNSVKRSSIKIKGEAFKLLGGKNDTQVNQNNQNESDRTKIDDFLDDDLPPF